jgi:ABC-type transport system involved in cytochrome c biogenesis permease subunit
MSHQTSLPLPAEHSGVRLFRAVLLWFGIVVLGLILIYSSILSALPPVRWTLELTEMQAFRHWLFVELVASLAVCLVLAMIFCPRPLLLSAGALTAHLGLLLLIGGAAAYFGTKVEGDVLLQSPAILVRAQVAGRSAIIGRFPAAQDMTWSRALPHRDELLRVGVLEIQPDGMQPVAAAIVGVQVGQGQPRIITLSDRPDDWQPIDDGLSLRLATYPPQTCFYDDEVPALYVRNSVTGSEVAKRIERLPIYHERYLAEEGVLRDTRGRPVPSKRIRPELKLPGLTIPTGWFEPWRMPIEVNKAGETPALPFTVRVTGYLPYVVGLQPAADDPNRLVPLLEAAEQRRAGLSPRAMSAIRLEITGRGEEAGWSQTGWCLFSSYPDVDARPIQLELPGATGVWELVYSRARHELGAALAARRLSVTYFPGRRGIQSFHSEIVVQKGRAQPHPATVSTNQTVTVRPWTLFQSGFDFENHWSYTILGVGNRVGMWPMNIGWVMVTVGCLYAFYVKPLLLRRARGHATHAPMPRVCQGLDAPPACQSPRGRALPTALLIAAGLLVCSAGCRPEAPYQASQAAAGLDRQIKWRDARLIVVQEAGRYKTLEALARELFTTMTGREHLRALSPMASLLEWLFHRDAYADTPLIKVREAGLRVALTAHLGEDQRQRILESKCFTPRELADPVIEGLLSDLETRPLMRRAVNRVRAAQAVAENLERLLAIVPQPDGDAAAPWFTPPQLLANLSDAQLRQLGLTRATLPSEYRQPVPGISPDQALAVAAAWSSLRAAWLKGDPATVQTYLDRLSQVLPTLAEPGVYPARSQRQAEVRYYSLGKFTGGWVLYFLALLISVPALLTGGRTFWVITLGLLLAALAWHAYGVSLRWYILGRIPVANMFEAVVASAWMGIAAAVLIEVFLRTRIFLVAASMTGFLALLAAGYVLPGGELSTIPGILDDIQLRIHTVLIIAAYALIFLAAVIAVVYLIGYYALRLRGLATNPVDRGLPPPVLRRGTCLPSPASGSAAVLGASGQDARTPRDVPGWLNAIDANHLIILNMVFVLLFVGGIVLGAWWADYSWGRPWGWDPKEVFALNTWIIYAILIHIRFVVRRRGLWTAWLSIAGCLMMAFNWFFVNFFISSVHSYA